MPIITTDNGPVVVDPTTTPQRPSKPAIPQLGMEWVGTDGVVWDLARGPVEILSGARGFGLPTPQHWRRQALGHGADHRGLRFPPREVYMPVEVVSSSAMLDLDRSFNAGFDPYSTGRLRVTTPDNESREIICRYDEGLEGEYDIEPVLKGSAVYPIRMTAEDPFWHGTPVVMRVPFDVDTGGPTFPGPPFYRARTATLNKSATITNPGDVESYAVWTVTAPFKGFTVGIGDQFVRMVLTKATGSVTIDTTGGHTTMLDENGVNVRSFARNFKSPPIPKGETTMTLDVTDPAPGTEVEVSFTPLFYRAW